MIFNMVGGAGGGKDGAATLTVTAPTNTNITVSKDTKSYTKNSGSTGVAVFQGLTTGQWTVSISNGQQTQTRTINITTTYSIVIAFFAATINITYPAGSTCTVTKGSTVFTAPDTSGAWDCVVPSTGTWVVGCTDGVLSSSQNVAITADGQTESVTLAYFTATINITYPATSPCTVTDSSGATIATDTNTTTSTKTFVTAVHATGTYTIAATATDSSGKTKSTTVSITTDGQSESVTLTYELLLFDNGLVDGIAWDYVYNQNAFASSSISDVIKMRSQTMDIDGVRTSPRAYRGISTAIDLSDYSILKIQTKACASSAGRGYFQIGTSLSGSNLGQVAITKEAGQTTSIDVSAINQSGFIMMQVFGGDDYGATIDISFDKVWAE